MDLARSTIRYPGKLPSIWVIGLWFISTTQRDDADTEQMHRANILALCKAGCFGSCIRMAHRAITQAEGVGFMITSSFIFSKLHLSPSQKETEEAMEGRFIPRGVTWLTLGMRHKDVALALVADPELCVSSPLYNEVTHALVEMCTRNDLFSNFGLYVSMIFVYTIHRLRVELDGEDSEARSFQKLVVARVQTKSPRLWETALAAMKEAIRPSDTWY